LEKISWLYVYSVDKMVHYKEIHYKEIDYKEIHFKGG